MQRKKKRNEYFILSLFWEQRRSRKQWAGLNIPSFFTLTAHNSECLWLFAFLPPNSAGAMSNIFSLDSMLNTSPIWWLPLQHPSPCTYISERRPQSHPNCQSQLLGYWLQSITVFEKMHEEEIQILPTLFLITDSWLWALPLYKPLDSSWAGDGGYTVLETWPYCVPFLLYWG